MAPKAKCQPNTLSPLPNSATAPATITIKPAAGPLMVNRDPLKILTTIPPTMAVNNPIIGGKSDALAIPKLKGSANKNTINPDTASEEKFSLSPARPSFGNSNLFFMG